MGENGEWRMERIEGKEKKVEKVIVNIEESLRGTLIAARCQDAFDASGIDLPYQPIES